MLAAGADADEVGSVVKATTDVGEVQAGGGSGAALSTATQHRRKAVDRVVDRAVKALAQWDAGAESKRSEIRGIVDQISRRADLADAWIDATLRDLPDDTFGFAAFEDRNVTVRSDTETSSKATQPRRGATRTTRRDEEQPRERANDAEARAARAQRARQARLELKHAARDLAAAERKVDAARRAVRDAEDNLRVAEEAHAAAQQRHEEASAKLEEAEQG